MLQARGASQKTTSIAGALRLIPWSEDGKTCTAERVCTGDSSHVDREVVEAVGKVTTPATCTAKGWTTYTAAFTNDWTETQTKVLEDVEMIPHSYGLRVEVE